MKEERGDNDGGDGGRDQPVLGVQRSTQKPHAMEDAGDRSPDARMRNLICWLGGGRGCEDTWWRVGGADTTMKGLCLADA